MFQEYVNWLVLQGFAIASINLKLSTIKAYAKLAHKAGIIPELDYRKDFQQTAVPRRSRGLRPRLRINPPAVSWHCSPGRQPRLDGIWSLVGIGTPADGAGYLPAAFRHTAL